MDFGKSADTKFYECFKPNLKIESMIMSMNDYVLHLDTIFVSTCQHVSQYLEQNCSV